MTDDELQALLDVRFGGPGRAVDHWENWLLTDCTRRAPMPDDLVHPVILFHLPIQAASTSIGELFAHGGVDGSAGTVGLLGYDWEYLQPLREGVVYRGDGGFVSVDRVRGGSGDVLHDDVSYSIELIAPDGVAVARITNHWRFRRDLSARSGERRELPEQRSAGATIPPLVVSDVGVDRMKTMAALLRDPYPVHWDPDALRAAGLGDRPINQGPLNVSYVMNMLMAFAGETALRRLDVSFHGIVRDGDTVEAGGTVDETIEVDGETRRRCSVWLDRDDTRLLSGTAEIL